MYQCTACNFVADNKKNGEFTNHLKTHNMTLAEYLIKTEYKGIPPKCKCGYCDELPTFYRGRFTDYAENHKVFSVRETLYKKKFGIPKCFECGGEVGFNRGEPKKYCSRKCNGKNAGFSLATTQETIKKSVRNKYGVDNVSELDSVKNKLKISSTGQVHPHTEESKQKISQASKKKWQDPTYRQLVVIKAKDGCNTEKEIKRRSIYQHLRWQDPDYAAMMLDTVIVNRLSKLHIKIKRSFELEKLGFVSEQKVGRYLVDELHKEKKIVIEVNGDYVHANPKLYKADDIIIMPGNSYTAAEKWESDNRKLNKLKQLGYRVLVVWQSDDLEKKKQELQELLDDNFQPIVRL